MATNGIVPGKLANDKACTSYIATCSVQSCSNTEVMRTGPVHVAAEGSKRSQSSKCLRLLEHDGTEAEFNSSIGCMTTKCARFFHEVGEWAAQSLFYS